MNIEWKCPKCGAPANGHGRGGRDRCQEGPGNECSGFLCMCTDDTDEHHGETFADPCHEAVCHHCNWGGTFPVKPKGLQAWEKKALDAGWTMPQKRADELELAKEAT